MQKIGAEISECLHVVFERRTPGRVTDKASKQKNGVPIQPLHWAHEPQQKSARDLIAQTLSPKTHDDRRGVSGA
jgi:hypothetical protein